MELMIKVYMLLVLWKINLAFKAGIKPGDHIIAIDGQSTSDITVEEASSKIRGEAGTVVALDIEREWVKSYITISLENL